MTKHFLRFFKNKEGSLSVEFVGVFFVFIALLYVIYDIYTSISLQSKLERTTYVSASLFRERSALYPLLDDSISGLNAASSLCLKNSNSCFKSYELIAQEQVNEIRTLASSLSGKEVAVSIDALFLLQDTRQSFVASIPNAQNVTFSFTSCPVGGCSNEINDYFNARPKMDNTTTLDYTNFVPFVNRDTSYYGSFTHQYITGRWIPLYRVNMCIANEESLYLKLFNSNRKRDGILPNLCSEVVVLSRCNNILDPTQNCPIYIK